MFLTGKIYYGTYQGGSGDLEILLFVMGLDEKNNLHAINLFKLPTHSLIDFIHFIRLFRKKFPPKSPKFPRLLYYLLKIYFPSWISAYRTYKPEKLQLVFLDDGITKPVPILSPPANLDKLIEKSERLKVFLDNLKGI